jgi:hypothetical protein
MIIFACNVFFGLLVGVLFLFSCVIVQLIVSKLFLPKKRDKFEQLSTSGEDFRGR